MPLFTALTTPFKKWLFTLVLNLSFCVFSFAAADLIVTQGDFTPKSISKCENLTASVIIKNNGDLISGKCHASLVISSKSDFSTPFELSRVVIKSLGRNESVTIEYVYPIPNTLTAGTYYLAVELDSENEVVENNENNSFIFNSTLNLKPTILNSLKTPYPFIFIHGLGGDGATWDAFTDDLDVFYGWNFGGQMNFCLNYDGNKFTSNFAVDYKNFDNTIVVGDYYYINFAVAPNGVVYKADSQSTYDIQSNQSAIYKQGRAVRDAIKKVLAITGAEKVILVGHSMGGLAAREYLQNSAIYQADGKHHVAKLFTIGTPHGGSNATSLGVNIFDKIDEKSEAVRDLRYVFPPFYGRYLFGGIESTSILFSNDDINCNNYVGDNILGLNQKSLPKDIAYSCTIGNSSILGGDGVVDDKRANINLFPVNSGVAADTFVDRVSPIKDITQHTELHKRTANNMKGMDEPLLFTNAYSIASNKLYYGFITQQSQTAFYQYDYDDYKLETTKKGAIRLQMWDIPVHDFNIDLYNSSLKKVCNSIVTNSRCNIDTTILNLPADTYYLEISGYPTPISFYYPYAYKLSFSASTPTIDIADYPKIEIYPNPASDKITIKIKELSPSVQMHFMVVDLVGIIHKNQKILNESTEISINDLPNGIYLINILGDNQFLGSQKLVVNR